MHSRLLLNIALLALVIALAMVVYHSADENAGEVTPLTTLSPGAVTDIRILHNRRETMLRKQGERWIMTQPVRIDANGVRTGTLLKLLATNSQADYAIAGLDLAQYGLERPATSIRFNNLEIAFGISNPVNGLRYVRVGERMHLIDDGYFPLLSSQTGTLVARELLPRDADISKLVLPGMTLSRDAGGGWRSDGDAGADAIAETLDNWKHVQAFGVHNYLRRKALARIEVYLGDDPEALHFVVTDTDPWLIIARPALELEYHFNLDAYDGLLRPGASRELPEDVPADLREELESPAVTRAPEPGA